MDAEEAREAGYSVKTGRFPFRASGKALAMDRTDGLVQLVVDEEDGRVLGGAILGPEAADMISEVALAVENELTAEELAGTIHPHPTLPEAIMEAAEDVYDRAVHIL
jgi:dihydrolipoamide dehydrogenase